MHPIVCLNLVAKWFSVFAIRANLTCILRFQSVGLYVCLKFYFYFNLSLPGGDG
jgi:hypothetical protein